MKVIYIAGPYRHPKDLDSLPGIAALRRHAHVRAAQSARDRADKLGCVAVAPHLLSDPWTWNPESDQVMRRIGLALLAECDAVLVLPGWEASAGTKAEIDAARSQDKPVFYPDGNEPDWKGLKAWIDSSAQN